MKIIVNLICLNSEPELPALLASLKGRVDAIVAIDGGSTDKTVETIETWGKETGTQTVVEIHPWPDDFAKQRNTCLDTTRTHFGVSTAGDPVWILMIDTDDTLAEFDRAYIEEAIAKNNIAGIVCKMDNGNGFFYNGQFFKLSPNTRWKNAIHEFIVIDGANAVPKSGTLTIKRGRSMQHNSDPERNVRIGRRFVESEPTDLRGRFYLGRDLLECETIPLAQRRAESEGHLRYYVSLCGIFPEQDRYARLLLVRILCETGRLAEAREFLLKTVAADPDNKSAYEALSRISSEKESAVWERLSSSACGNCILPHGNQLPSKALVKQV